MSEKGFVYILKDTHFKRGVKIERPQIHIHDRPSHFRADTDFTHILLKSFLQPPKPI